MSGLQCTRVLPVEGTGWDGVEHVPHGPGEAAAMAAWGRPQKGQKRAPRRAQGAHGTHRLQVEVLPVDFWRCGFLRTTPRREHRPDTRSAPGEVHGGRRHRTPQFLQVGEGALYMYSTCTVQQAVADQKRGISGYCPQSSSGGVRHGFRELSRWSPVTTMLNVATLTRASSRRL